MEVNRDRVIKEIAVFVLDNQKATINFLNQSGYANLSRNSGRKVINKAISRNMFNEQFWVDFVSFMEDTKEGEKYYNVGWVAITQIVSAIATSINDMVIAAKQALFQRNMAFRQDERNKETEEFYKELAELNAMKEMSISMNMAQQEVLLRREKQEEQDKTIRYIAIFGVFVAGALTIAYITKRNK